MCIANTFFEHDDEKMVTYHDLKSDTGDDVSILYFAKIDFLLVWSIMA